MIIDSLAFFNNKRYITFCTKVGIEKNFTINLNFSTQLYFELISSLDFIRTTDNTVQKVECLYNICAKLLSTNNKRITYDYLYTNVDVEIVMDIVTKIADALNELIGNDAFVIPNIKPKQKEPLKDKERQQTRENIERLQSHLDGKMDTHLIDDVVIVMEKTGSSFEDVMRMPILIFKDIVRSVVLMDKRQDDDYNLAYLKYEYERLKEKIKNGEAIEPQAPKQKGAVLDKLRKMLG